MKNHWKLTILKDLCNPNDGVQIGPFGSQLHASDYVESGIPVVMPKDMVNNEISLESIACVSEETANRLAKHRLKTGDLVFARRGDVGNFALVQPHQAGWLCGTGSIRVRLKPDIHPEFISLLLQSHTVRHWLQSNAVGQTMLNLNTEIISNLPLRVTDSLDTQITLANDIQKWDRAIALTEKLISAKRRLKQGLMHKLLSQDTSLKLIKPTSWDVGELSKYVSDFIVPMRDKPKSFNGNIPWCRIEDLNGRYLSDSKSGRYVSEETINSMNLKIYPIDTVLCSCSANLGVCAIVKNPLITNQTFIGLVCKSNLDPEFLYYSLTFRAKSLQSSSSGTTISYLSRKRFEQFKIFVPDLETQRRIRKILNLVDDEISLLQQYQMKLVKQKCGLMQKLLTGDIQISTLDDAA